MVIILSFETVFSMRELNKKRGRMIWPAHSVMVSNRRITDLWKIVKVCSQLFQATKVSQVVVRINLNP